MRRLLGAACILSAGGFCWGRGWWETRQTRRRLAGMCLLLGRMAEEIRQTRRPLLQVLELAGETGDPDCRRFCRRVAESLKSGQDAANTWEKSVKEISLRDSEKRALCQLSADLRGDEQQLCRALLRTRDELMGILEQRDRESREVQKTRLALWLSGPMLLVILLS